MVEKWMQSKPNPYMNPNNNKNAVIKRTTPKVHMNMQLKNHIAHYGKPIQQFKDSDKDGVPNVFDCKPFNKRKQDVMMPRTGSNPLQELYGRKEAYRQQMAYQRQLRQLEQLEQERQRLEAANLAELERIQTPTVTSSGGGSVVYYPSPTVYSNKTGSFVPASSKEGKAVVQSTINQAKNASYVQSGGTSTMYTAPKTTVTSIATPKTTALTPSLPKVSTYKAPTPAPKTSVISRIVSIFKRK